MATPEAALKLEIARLTGAINRHRSGEGQARPPYSTTRTTYVNPSYKPPSSKSYVRSEHQASGVNPTTSSRPSSTTVRPPSGPGPSNSTPQDVTINGVVFESSKRSLVRKDIMPSAKPSSVARPRVQSQYSRNRLDGGPRTRAYKPKGPSRGHLKLDNTRRSYRSQRTHGKKKYIDKPCPRFTTTGSCNRGLTCMYKHDPAKIAICWPFLQGNCPHTAETCPLSHDSNPHRTPLCVHFANAGRCTRANCQYPHVHVGRREGVCRDFAVLGFCEAGIECSKQHVRECPDFAESGECPNKFCKLPHVIRANRTRKHASAPVPAVVPAAPVLPVDDNLVSDVAVPVLTVEDSQLGDEYISLTFNESEEDNDSGDDSDDEEEEGDSPSPGNEDADDSD
ncbi:hypothetical protein DFH94DRAFT_795213 [Russula ochroleuca]|uniref:C3H1-type domain-containing protein n=1 Tax=Russula ochroleuca TaxID=152965 RepID=A0A9P5K0F1_9AGAM|nr:hypothetical protein DFH94DRAFT_795213 [Russula ochroleuca]